MARPLIPFVQNGYYASRNWIPLVKGNGFTTSGGGEQEEVWETSSGSIVTFNAVAAPLRQLSVSVKPVQNLNGYDNPWPAGGGVNKLKVTATTQTINGVTFTVNDDGSVNVNGTATANAILILNSYDFDGTAVILNGCPSGGSGSTFKLDAFGASGLSEDIGSGVTISTSGTRNVRIVVFSGATVSNKLFKPMLRLASVTDATFAPYSNICPITGWDSVNIWVQPTHDTTAEPTATIQLGETVYGGTLDAISGTMTVTLGSKMLNGTERWAGTADYGWYIVANDLKKLTSYRGHIISDKFPCGTRANGWIAGYNDSGNRYPNENWIYYTDDTLASAAQVKSFFEDNPTLVVYELATPFELTLTPEQIATLQGTNNVWSDAGNVTVEYRAR